MKKLLFVFCLFIGLTSYADWENEQKIISSDGDIGDMFGNSVAIDGDYAVLGATGDDDNGAGSGSAYIFHKDGTSWVEHAKLTASDGANEDHFGHSVSISGNYVVIGAPWDSDNGYESGSVYIFHKIGTVWTEQAKITPSDGEDADWFGQSVSIDGNFVVISAYGDDENGSKSGSAYIFQRDGTSWNQQAKLIPSDGEIEDWFSYSVSISGDYTVIGNHRDDDTGDDSGSAYIFHRNGTTWTEEAKITASDGATFDWFGYFVSIDGDYAAIGAYGDDDNGEKSGSAYIFHRNGTTWTEQAKLTAPDGMAEDWFGVSVSLFGDYTVVGSLSDVNGQNSGSAYIYKRSETNWIQQDKITPSDGAEGDFFGRTVCLSGDNLLISSFQDDDNGSQSGSAYIYENGGVFIDEKQMNQQNIMLFCNYPNPLITNTTISFNIAFESAVFTINIFNIKGQKVKTLIEDNFPPGNYAVLWDGKDDQNTPVCQGVYFYEMTSENYVDVRQMILLR